MWLQPTSRQNNPNQNRQSDCCERRSPTYCRANLPWRCGGCIVVVVAMLRLLLWGANDFSKKEAFSKVGTFGWPFLVQNLCRSLRGFSSFCFPGEWFLCSCFQPDRLDRLRNLVAPVAPCEIKIVAIEQGGYSKHRHYFKVGHTNVS